MAKKEKWGLTDEQVEQEIEKLRGSEAVRLARRHQKLIYQQRHRRRQCLYQLRNLEKKGEELMKEGITRETLDAIYDFNAPLQNFIKF